MLVHQLDVMVVDPRSAHSRQDDADRERDKHQTRHALGPTLALLEDNGISDEEHVQKSVKDRHVQTDQKNDNLLEEQLEGSDQEDTHALREWTRIEIRFGDVVLVASLLSELLGAASENGRGVRLGDSKGDGNPDDKGEDELDPVEPSPASAVGNEATNERTDGRTNERSGREGGHGHATLFVAPEIGQGPTNESHGGREGDAVNEAANNERFDVLGDSTRNDEYYSNEKG